MDAVLIALFCGLLFIFMRGSSQVFGKTVGTLMGCAFLGWIILGVGTLLAAVIIPILLPLLVPLAMVCGLWWLIRKACTN